MSRRTTTLGTDSEVKLGFQRVDGYTPAGWPSATKQFHLDFGVPDLAKAEQALLEQGATRPEFQPGGDRWLVLVDPAGHPFCLSPTT